MRNQANGQSSPSHGPGAVSQGGLAFTGAAHAAGSVLKTSVLRRDRVSETDYAARLAVCRKCPGGHATFKRDGRLHTCGPMLESMKGNGQGTCGCVLAKKARDAKESCPFGYWPTIEHTRVERVSLPVLNAQAGRLGRAAARASAPPAPPLGPSRVSVMLAALHRWRRLGRAPWNWFGRGGSRGPSVEPFQADRRRFMGQTAGGFFGLVALAMKSQAWASAGGGTCHIEASVCGGEGSIWIPCTEEVVGEQVGTVYRKTDKYNKCYKLEAKGKRFSGESSDSFTKVMNGCDDPDCNFYELIRCDQEHTIITNDNKADLSGVDAQNLAELVGDVVEIGGACYTVQELEGETEEAPEPATISDVHEDCEDCVAPCNCPCTQQEWDDLRNNGTPCHDLVQSYHVDPIGGVCFVSDFNCDPESQSSIVETAESTPCHWGSLWIDGCSWRVAIGCVDNAPPCRKTTGNTPVGEYTEDCTECGGTVDGTDGYIVSENC